MSSSVAMIILYSRMLLLSELGGWHAMTMLANRLGNLLSRILIHINSCMSSSISWSRSYAGLYIYWEIRVFHRAVGNTGNYQEILGNTGKYWEIPGNRKAMGTPLWVANIMAWCLNQS